MIIASEESHLNEKSTLSQSKNHSKIIALIPAYNEERFIGSVVLKASQYVDLVIVVDDGSQDKTANIATQAGAIVLRHAQNRGKGVALNTGFRKASELQPDVVITIDADGQHLPEEIDEVMQPILDDQADIVIGSRYLKNTSDVPGHRVWGHRAFNLLTTIASGVSSTDSQSGFRAFSLRAVNCFALQSNGFSVESEMQFLVNEHNLDLLEMPITIRYPDKPKRNVFHHGFMVLNGILRLMGQYRPLLFFGFPGLVSILFGMALGLWVANIYQSTSNLAIGYALISILFFIMGMVSFSTGIILHSVRGLLRGVFRANEQVPLT